MYKNITKPHKFKVDLFKDNRGHLLTVDLQSNIFLKKKFEYELFSYSSKKNIFRGMHFQKPPSSQHKLLILIKGRIMDYLINIDNKSQFGKIYKFEMNTGDALWIPEGFCHGFTTLSKEVLINYKLTCKFSKKNYCGILPEKFGLRLNKKYRSNQDKSWATSLDNLKKINWD